MHNNILKIFTPISNSNSAARINRGFSNRRLKNLSVHILLCLRLFIHNMLSGSWRYVGLLLIGCYILYIRCGPNGSWWNIWNILNILSGIIWHILWVCWGIYYSLVSLGTSYVIGIACCIHDIRCNRLLISIYGIRVIIHFL